MNQHLQEKLNKWCEQLNSARTTKVKMEKGVALKAFCDCFLPTDIDKEDYLHFWKVWIACPRCLTLIR